MRIVGTKGVASRIALTLANSPFPAEASNIPTLAVWPCSTELLPLFRQPPPPPGPPTPLLVAFSASASAFVWALSYPNSYPRKYGYVQPAGQQKFLVLPYRLTVFTDYESPSETDHFSFLFLRGTSVKRSRDPSPLCQLQRFVVSLSSFIRL